ncbi:AAEL012164-PA [Aedes aegypti]|uniref:AAEL012164-PA n=1 Tax=Aedes aegypti TaxID=7159 RepID=Q16MW1_AEDAE|nr:AAEL012164-PA [Aedes aegypti]
MAKMNYLVFLLLFGCQLLTRADDLLDSEEPPEGYYAFIESPSAVPPKVRSPPYTHINIDCKDATNPKPYVSANNLCGDLNKGKIPRNPMRQSVMGEPYPFELIRNQTLKFLSKTLPVLKADDTLPKVTQIMPDETVDQFDDNGIGRRMGKVMRMTEDRRDEEEPRTPRKFCDGGGVFCALYRAIQGEPISSKLVAERREEIPSAYAPPPPRYDGPPTPCPAKVEYATPVFAKNYQGSWRYVVQIPYEGYFTQTVEVTRCLQARCHYLDGGCLSSPRWVSLLVAEIFYPNAEEFTTSTSTTTAPSIQDFQAYQQYLQKRAGLPTGADSGSYENTSNHATRKSDQHCDGHDEIGCFQVRLYYDWFLIPGSCKCWRPDYFAKYVRKRPTPEL